MTEHDTAAVLTADEWGTVKAAARASLGCDGYGSHGWLNSGLLNAVERILTARLAARPPQDDPQPDEREALADKIVTAMARELDHGTRILAAARIAADAVLAAGFRRDPDAGLRERVRELTGEWVRLGWLDPAEADTPTNHLLRDLVAALANTAPGSES